MTPHAPLVLVILDGFGYREEKQHNAIATAHTPHWDHWWKTAPHMLLQASGEAVGLPAGQMGNSEVGHMHIGAGRVVLQDFTRINAAIENRGFAANPLFIKTIEELKRSRRTLHVLGLLSKGGVHSHEQHLFSFLALCKEQAFSNVCLHLFLDGRDTAPQSALSSLQALNDILKRYPVATICSLTGRYYAMDRDQRWPRTESVYRLLTEPDNAVHFETAIDAVESYYTQHITDEFIPPTRIGKGVLIQEGDAVFFFNFRSDRARQLTDSLISEHFLGFHRPNKPTLSHCITMTSYGDQLHTDIAFPPLTLTHTLGEIIARHGLTQLRIGETEKYAHITFFLNGGQEPPFQNEHRILIPSPKVATYDLAPEMSAVELTVALVEAIRSNQYDLIICNYANADMVGHTGHFDATIRAIECLDNALYDVAEALRPFQGHLLITADHGNAECMFDEAKHQAHTAHTHSPVPLLYIGQNWHFIATEGSLTDVAPTILTLLGMTPPTEMTGKPLLSPNHD